MMQDSCDFCFNAMENTKLDKFDIAILRALTDNARMSWVELADRVNLSATACQRRTQLLRERGVIQRFTLDVDLETLGYDVEAFVAVSIERQNMAYAVAFRDAMRELPEIRSCYMLSGSVDFMLRVVSPSLREFGRFIQERILSLPGVKDATSSLVLEEIAMKSAVPAGPA